MHTTTQLSRTLYHTHPHVHIMSSLTRTTIERVTSYGYSHIYDIRFVTSGFSGFVVSLQIFSPLVRFRWISWTLSNSYCLRIATLHCLSVSDIPFYVFSALLTGRCVSGSAFYLSFLHCSCIVIVRFVSIERSVSMAANPLTPPAELPIPPSVSWGALAMATIYSGSVEGCSGFLLQCCLTFEMQPHHFPKERSKVASIISQNSAWPSFPMGHHHLGTEWPSHLFVEEFVFHFREVFVSSVGGAYVQEQLHRFHQERSSIMDYASSFRLAVGMRYLS